jgi:tetratricopeptide (TPR) repeat protein
MRTSYWIAASILGAVLAGCSTTQQQPAISPTGAITSAKANAVPDDAPPAKEPAFTAETRFAAGQLAESQNNPVAAIQQYQEALKLKPDHLGALYRMGVVYARLKDYPQAIDAWDRYVQATGESATAYGDLGFCEELAGDTAKAEAAYKAGIARDPKNSPCRVNYGLMLARRGQIDDAVTQWRFVLTEAEVHYNLGGVYATQGKKDQARAEFNKAIELDPNFTDAKTRVAALDQ